MSRLTDSVKAFKADPSLVNFGPKVTPGPSLLAQQRMPYEVANSEIARTLKWAWQQLQAHYDAQQANGLIALVRLALDHGEIEVALRSMAGACCEGEVVDNGGAWLECVNHPIPALQPILAQLPKMEAAWRKALTEVVA